jgi:hypothetical protein
MDTQLISGNSKRLLIGDVSAEKFHFFAAKLCELLRMEKRGKSETLSKPHPLLACAAEDKRNALRVAVEEVLRRGRFHDKASCWAVSNEMRCDGEHCDAKARDEALLCRCGAVRRPEMRAGRG